MPGLVFVFGGVAAFGRVQGAIVVFVSAVVAVTASFLIVRTVGGRALGEVDKPWMRRMLARLDRHPIITIAVLRLFMIMSPPLNYALALTNVRLRDYVIGSALGLIPPVIVYSFLFDWLVTVELSEAERWLTPLGIVALLAVIGYVVFRRRRAAPCERSPGADDAATGTTGDASGAAPATDPA